MQAHVMFRLFALRQMLPKYMGFVHWLWSNSWLGEEALLKSMSYGVFAHIYFLCSGWCQFVIQDFRGALPGRGMA